MVELTAFLTRVDVHPESLVFHTVPPRQDDWTRDVEPPDRIIEAGDGQLRVFSPVKARTRGGRVWLTNTSSARSCRPNAALINALKRAHAELQLRGIDVTAKRPVLVDPRGVEDPYLRKLSTLAFLAPDIQARILEGRHPPSLRLAGILARGVPPCWGDQRRVFGFPADGSAGR